MVRKLKEANAPDIDVTRAVAELKARKNILDNKVMTIIFCISLFMTSKSFNGFLMNHLIGIYGIYFQCTLTKMI